jgi:hypothetical protein
MDHLADRLDEAADQLTTVDRRMPGLTVPAAAFGAATDAGLPGRLGHELHAHWAAVLQARSREAATAAAKLSETARSVRTTQRAYEETDELVGRRLRRES